MTTPFADPRRTNRKEQADSQASAQLPSAVPWSVPHPSQFVGYEQLSELVQSHPTIPTDIQDSSGYDFSNPLNGVFPQDSFAAISHSSTRHAQFDPLGDGVTEEWGIQHRQQLPETHSQSFDPRVQHQGAMQPSSDFQSHSNLESAGGPFIHLSGIASHSMGYASSQHPLSSMPSTTPAHTGSISTIPTRMESSEHFRQNIESVPTSFQVQQYGTSHMHDAQSTRRFFGFSAQSPRSSISQDDAYSIALAMTQLPLADSQQASDAASSIPRGSNERQVGSLTVATSNLALSTPCTSPSVSTSPYSVTQPQQQPQQQQLDIPTGTDGTMDNLGKSSGGQCITAKGKRRTRRNKGDPSSLSMADPSLPDSTGTGIHKKIANKRSRDRLSQTHSTSPIPLIQHQSSTLVSYAFNPATSSDPLPQTPSASSSPSVASSSSISMGLPPQPPGLLHNPYAHHSASIDLSSVQTSSIVHGGPSYAPVHPSQPQQSRTALQYRAQQSSPAQYPSYSFNTSISPPSNTFAENYRNVRPAVGISAFKDPATGLMRTLDSSQTSPRQIINRRRSSQGYSSDTLSTPGEVYPARSDYFGYMSLSPQPVQALQPSQSSVLYHPYQQEQSTHLHSSHQPQHPSRSLNMPQQHQQQHQEAFQDQLYRQQQQPHQQQLPHHHQEQLHLLQQQQQQHLQRQQLQNQQQEFQLQQQQLQIQQNQQHQQQLQHVQQLHRSQFASIFVQVDPQELGTQSDDEYATHFSSSPDILTTAGRVKVPRTRARSRTLPTLGDLEDVVVESLAQPQPLLMTLSQRTGSWPGNTQHSTGTSSIMNIVHSRATLSISSVLEAPSSARIEELDSASPSPSHDNDMEATAASEDAADLENELEETAASNIPTESSSSSSTAVSTRQPRHPCPRCSKRFTRPFNLRSHILAHDNERPYACDGKMATGAKCKSRFARRHDLVRHIKAKHPDYSKDKDQKHESRARNIHEKG